MTEIKLKSCPFCGGKAEKVEQHSDFTFTVLVYIRCTDCFAQTPIYNKYSDWYDEEYMIECWNRRAETYGGEESE